MIRHIRWGAGVIVLAGAIMGGILLMRGNKEVELQLDEIVRQPATVTHNNRRSALQKSSHEEWSPVTPLTDSSSPSTPRNLPQWRGDGRDAHPAVIRTRKERRGTPSGVATALPPVTLTAQIMQEAQQRVEITGPDTEGSARDLLSSEYAEDRYLAAVTLSEIDRLQEQDLEQLAQDTDLSVPVNSLGWLIDSGRSAKANQLTSLLVDQGVTTDTLIQCLSAESITESGKRAALELLSASLIEPEAATAVLAPVGKEAANAYGVRMKALFLLRNTMPFEEYRAFIENLSHTGDTADVLWNEGISRLASRLTGPPEIHTGALVWRKSTIDLMLAHEFPMYLEDLAQQVEYALGLASTYIQPGTSQYLTDCIEELKQQPLTATDLARLRRLESAADSLEAREDPTHKPPANFISMPLGID